MVIDFVVSPNLWLLLLMLLLLPLTFWMLYLHRSALGIATVLQLRDILSRARHSWLNRPLHLIYLVDISTISELNSLLDWSCIAIWVCSLLSLAHFIMDWACTSHLLRHELLRWHILIHWLHHHYRLEPYQWKNKLRVRSIWVRDEKAQLTLLLLAIVIKKAWTSVVICSHCFLCLFLVDCL